MSMLHGIMVHGIIVQHTALLTCITACCAFLLAGVAVTLAPDMGAAGASAHCYMQLVTHVRAQLWEGAGARAASGGGGDAAVEAGAPASGLATMVVHGQFRWPAGNAGHGSSKQVRIDPSMLRLVLGGERVT